MSIKSSTHDGGIGTSLVSMTGPGGATLTTGAPIAANTIGNKPAIAGSSLYQACLSLRDRLWSVPNFGETFLDINQDDPLSSTKIPSSDPVTQLWQCFRLGAPLCWLYNQLHPDTPLPLSQDANRNNANECKKQVAKFIMALQHNLRWDPDAIFTVSQLYLNDTNGFVKVVRTISKLLDVFEARGLLIEAPQSAATDELEKPSDDRAWIVRELLNTERKYVQDLEVLQSYARALAQHDIIPSDTIHNLFGNLNTLVDVQRRFLICIEENVRRPVDDQHFGHVFRTMENDFAVYEPFCANYAQALDIINAEAPNLVQLKGLSVAEDCYLEPSYELPTFLIKPVQRICKYPLLLEQLLKKTPEEAPYLPELVDGLQCIRRITDKVNETSRLQENIQIVRDLQARVEDWKGHTIATFGNLLLSDVFMVSKSDTEREYHVYLFEKILLCCKEVLPNTSKKNSKSNSLLKQKHSVTPTPPGKKPRTTLQLKGRIFINNVTNAIPNNKVGSVLGSAAGGQYALHVWWRGDVDQESFSLRCKNEEQLKQWQTAINKLIEDVNARKHHIAMQYSHSAGVSPGGAYNMAGAGANGRRSGSVSHSLFPQTPVSEMPPFAFSRTNSRTGAYRTGDDEPLDGEGGTFSGRGTPLGGRYSQPAEQRERQFSISNDTRPRARTEDQDGSTLVQWRSHSPAVHPPLPRNGTNDSTPHMHQVRKASSSRQLRQGAAHPHAFPRPPRRNDSSSDMEGTIDQLDGISLPGMRSRVDSASSRGTVSSDMMQHNRSRSASNPALYATNNQAPPPPLPRAPVPGYAPAAQADAVQQSQQSANGPTSSNKHRFSSSSISTTDSRRSSRSRPGSTAASSPITLSGSSGGASGQHFKNTATRPSAGTSVPPPHSAINNGVPQNPPHQSNAVKLVIHHGDDKLVVVVLSSVTLSELSDKVAKKIRLISGRKVENLKIRYIDEDGDRILMHDDEDVQMAFENSRTHGADVDLVVT